MPLDQYRNFATSSLTASITSSESPIPVSDAAQFADPANGNYNVVILSGTPEIVRVTGRDTGANELTVQRGQENSSATSHGSGTEVTQSVTAKLISDIRAELGGGSSGISSLAGGIGILPASIGDGDTLSVDWGDANDLDADGNVTGGDGGGGGGGISSLTGGDGIDPSSIGDGDTVALASGGVTDTELGVDPFVYDPGMTEFGDGLSDEEVNRIALQSGESLAVERIELRQKGGGSSTQISLGVHDATAGVTVASTDLGETTKNPSTPVTGSTVLIRVSNNTNSPIVAAPRVQGYITGV